MGVGLYIIRVVYVKSYIWGSEYENVGGEDIGGSLLGDFSEVFEVVEGRGGNDVEEGSEGASEHKHVAEAAVYREQDKAAADVHRADGVGGRVFAHHVPRQGELAEGLFLGGEPAAVVCLEPFFIKQREGGRDAGEAVEGFRVLGPARRLQQLPGGA